MRSVLGIKIEYAQSIIPSLSSLHLAPISSWQELLQRNNLILHTKKSEEFKLMAKLTN